MIKNLLQQAPWLRFHNKKEESIQQLPLHQAKRHCGDQWSMAYFLPIGLLCGLPFWAELVYLLL